MNELLLFIATTSIFDGVATSQQAIILILLFSSEKPVANSVAYIAGIFSAYLLCGSLGLMAIDKLNAFIQTLFPFLNNISNQDYYSTQLFMGIALFIAGPIYLIYKKVSKRPPMEIRLLESLKRINPAVTFILGAFISATSFPAALPYIASLGKIAASQSAAPVQFLLLLLYNALYLLPLLLPFALYLLLRNRIEDIEKKLNFHVQRANIVLTIFLLSGMGLFMAADSALFFLTGHPIVSGKFLF